METATFKKWPLTRYQTRPNLFSGFLFLFTSVPPADDWAYRGSGGELTARQVPLKRTVRFHVSLYFRILSDDRAQTYYRTNLCNVSLNFPELSEDHRSRHSTGIELLAIDTFPRTVNDRCVSSPKINNLDCRTNAVLCNSHTCFFHGDVPLEARSVGWFNIFQAFSGNPTIAGTGQFLFSCHSHFQFNPSFQKKETKLQSK